MKTQFKKLAAVALSALPLSAIACSGSGDVVKPESHEGTVTVTGVNTSGLTSMSLPLSDVEATIDGKATNVTGISGILDLVNGGAQSVATFVVPPDARETRVVVRFDDYGGCESMMNGSAGFVDARGKVMTIVLPARTFDSGNAAVSLDVGRSLAPTDGGWIFEPHFTASF